MYDGRIVRELEGADLTETNIIASWLDVDARQSSSTRRPRRLMRSNLLIRFASNFALVTAVALFYVVYLFYHLAHPEGICFRRCPRAKR